MKCPRCNTPDTKVVDSRASRDGFTIRRRRHCVECGHRFTTYEQVAETGIFVIKKDRSRAPFDREKIRRGLEKACYKRPISPQVIEEIVGKVEAEISRLDEPEITTSRIGEMVMEELREADQVAYIRFASVYRQFQDVSDFQEEIRPMLSS